MGVLKIEKKIFEKSNVNAISGPEMTFSHSDM